MISIENARTIALAAQGLHEREPFGRGKRAVLQAIQHLGYVQLDTIHVVERAHHHVLWSRVPDYDPRILHELQSEDRKVFEYWSHAASYLPMSDYRFSLPRMRAMKTGRDRHFFRRNSKVMKEVLARIRAEGPLQAKDFEAPGHRSKPWFHWKPAKRALDQLWMEGELMTRERRGFQKVYDLAERVLPAEVDTTLPKPAELARHLILTGLRAHGLMTESEMSYLRSSTRTAVKRELRKMVADKELQAVRIEGLKDTFYARPAALERSVGIDPSLIRILSPFDSAVIRRKRNQALFGFDYQIECYVPEPKRRFGYFCLPVLSGAAGTLVGRIDAKAERENRRLLVHTVFVEKKGALDPSGKLFRDELERFARFNGCESVKIAKIRGIIKA